QLVLAILNYESGRNHLPLASTAPITGSDANVGNPGSAPTATRRGSQTGDGFSWIVQILPYIEGDTMYQKIADSAASNKLQKAAFPTQRISYPQNPAAAASAANPYVHEAVMADFICPSYPGE